MRESTVKFVWREPGFVDGFRSGVCLHGHTMHSRECLNFLPRYSRHVPGIRQVVNYYERKQCVDFARAWWTPPLTPASALRLEREQIADLGLRPMVSLTDHDDIEAGLALGVTTDAADTPISVEWTVPYERYVFHLGVHNIPRNSSPWWMAAMAEYTLSPREGMLPVILDEFARTAGVLIVLNHPFWLEEGVTEDEHGLALERLLRDCIGWLDAFELNGTRCWRENADTIELARARRRPLVSGGDRHACEPGACINLTNARNFAEFAAEIHAGHSSILFMPQYREPMGQRILDASRDILAGFSRVSRPGALGRPGLLPGPGRSSANACADMERPRAAMAGRRGCRGTVPWRRLGPAGHAGVSIRAWRHPSHEDVDVTIADFLRGDLSPEQAALLLSVGLVLGVFPIMGFPTLLCLLAALDYVSISRRCSCSIMSLPRCNSALLPAARAYGSLVVRKRRFLARFRGRRLGVCGAACRRGGGCVCVPSAWCCTPRSSSWRAEAARCGLMA